MQKALDAKMQLVLLLCSDQREVKQLVMEANIGTKPIVAFFEERHFAFDCLIRHFKAFVSSRECHFDQRSLDEIESCLYFRDPYWVQYYAH